MNNRKIAWITKFANSQWLTYIPYEDFYKNGNEIERKYHTHMVWSYDENWLCEYRNTRSFYWYIKRVWSYTQKWKWRLFLSWNENRTEAQSYIDEVASIL